MNMIQLTKRVAAACALLLLASCDVKDPIFETSHPGHAIVTLTTDWSAIGEGLNMPESYSVEAVRDGSDSPAYSATLTGVTNKLDHLFEPGDYRFWVYNTPEFVTVTDGVANVIIEEVAPSDAGEGPGDVSMSIVHPSPDWLYTAALDATLAADKEYTLTAPMQQQIRQLTIVFEPVGSAVDRIDRIIGSLTGVAGKYDMKTDTHSAPSFFATEFEKVTTGPDAGKWAATVRLLGIVGSEQMLSFDIGFTGSGFSFVDCGNLSQTLASFNEDKRTPFRLEVKKEVQSTSHPEHAKVTLTTEWSNIGTGLTAPESYTFEPLPAGSAYPLFSTVLTGVTNELTQLFDPGGYRFLVYNTPEHITVSGTTVSVSQTQSDNFEGAFIQANPGWAFTSLEEVELAADTEYNHNAVMQQQVRELRLIVTPPSADVDRIERLYGYLSGVASTLDLATGTHGDPVNVELKFEKITTGLYAGSWSASVRLLGIAGPQQLLIIHIDFAGVVPTFILTTNDLTEQLATFNTDKRTLMLLDVSTTSSTLFTPQIDDWQIAGGDRIVAE